MKTLRENTKISRKQFYQKPYTIPCIDAMVCQVLRGHMLRGPVCLGHQWAHQQNGQTPRLDRHRHQRHKDDILSFSFGGKFQLDRCHGNMIM